MDSTWEMIRGGYLSEDDRRELIELAREGSIEHRLARRANALVLLDRGMSCEAVGRVLLLDDDTIRSWHTQFEKDGLDGLMVFGYRGRDCRLSLEQQERLKTWAGEDLPRTTREVGAWLMAEFGIVYESRSGLIKLLNRLGLEHRRPEAVSRRMIPARQQAFIDDYEDLLNNLLDDEVVVFADAVHPTHSSQPAGCWVPKGMKLGLDQTTGRDRLNIHGAINLETGQTHMVDVHRVDAASTLSLLAALEARYPDKRLIHVFADNARYHHAKLVQAWMKQPGRRIKLHFVPAYCPHLNPIERLWGLMRKHNIHNRRYATMIDFSQAILGFLRHQVPRRWDEFSSTVSDNFRIITPADFRVLS